MSDNPIFQRIVTRIGEKATDAYRERTQGLGKKARRDREAKARTDALTFAMKYLQSESAEYRAEHVIRAADQFADYILNGTVSEGIDL